MSGLAFGVLVAIVKGHDFDARDALGNLSAPWVVAPFVGGTRFRRLWRSTVAGVAVTLAAFLGFYVAEAAILDLGTNSWIERLNLTLAAGRYWETWGLVSGSLYGLLGGLWASRRLPSAPAAIGLAFAAEPLIVFLLAQYGVWSRQLFDYVWMWIGEIAIGAIVVVVALRSATASGVVSPYRAVRARSRRNTERIAGRPDHGTSRHVEASARAERELDPR
jgi:hypothetical protein